MVGPAAREELENKKEAEAERRESNHTNATNAEAPSSDETVKPVDHKYFVPPAVANDVIECMNALHLTTLPSMDPSGALALELMNLREYFRRDDEYSASGAALQPEIDLEYCKELLLRSYDGDMRHDASQPLLRPGQQYGPHAKSQASEPLTPPTKMNDQSTSDASEPTSQLTSSEMETGGVGNCDDEIQHTRMREAMNAMPTNAEVVESLSNPVPVPDAINKTDPSYTHTRSSTPTISTTPSHTSSNSPPPSVSVSPSPTPSVNVLPQKPKNQNNVNLPT
eukprot:c18259_g1_i4.p2 GENE.c18259_g1_i4~~c18259_g1_i4.p2  ORF type:complete len:281 (+),score=56.77 c18259_g1_i4:1243-2085(+)